MPEATTEPEVEDAIITEEISEKKKKSKEPKEKKMKKSATSNGLGTFTRGKLVLARVNMLDGNVIDISIEVNWIFVAPLNENKIFSFICVYWDYRIFVCRRFSNDEATTSCNPDIVQLVNGDFCVAEIFKRSRPHWPHLWAGWSSRERLLRISLCWHEQLQKLAGWRQEDHQTVEM